MSLIRRHIKRFKHTEQRKHHLLSPWDENNYEQHLSQEEEKSLWLLLCSYWQKLNFLMHKMSGLKEKISHHIFHMKKKVFLCVFVKRQKLNGGKKFFFDQLNYTFIRSPPLPMCGFLLGEFVHVTVYEDIRDYTLLFSFLSLRNNFLK